MHNIMEMFKCDFLLILNLSTFLRVITIPTIYTLSLYHDRHTYNIIWETKSINL